MAPSAQVQRHLNCCVGSPAAHACPLLEGGCSRWLCSSGATSHLQGYPLYCRNARCSCAALHSAGHSFERRALEDFLRLARHALTEPWSLQALMGQPPRTLSPAPIPRHCLCAALLRLRRSTSWTGISRVSCVRAPTTLPGAAAELKHVNPQGSDMHEALTCSPVTCCMLASPGGVAGLSGC